MNAPDSKRRMPPLEAGRRAAGLALLGWLRDPQAPRLCRVSGTPGVGKSHLLAWLVHACTTAATPDEQRIHAVLPARGFGLRAAVWTLGRQLGLIAHNPDALLEMLARDDRRTVVCVPELDQSTEPRRLVAELLDQLLALPHIRLVVEAPTGGPAADAFTRIAEPAVMELNDPQWTDRARFNAWCSAAGADPRAYPLPGSALGHGEPPGAARTAAPDGTAELMARAPRRPDGSPDLRAADVDLLSDLWTAASRTGDIGLPATDPLLYALAGPDAVTQATEGLDDTISRAWDAAGPAVIDEPSPGVRAAILRVRLLGVDSAAASEAAGLPCTWAGRWAVWQGTEQWSGPSAALAVAVAAGRTPYGAQLLVADPGGVVRTYDIATGQRSGTVVVPAPKPLRGLAATADGSVVLLDAWGGTDLLAPPEPRPGLEPYAPERYALEPYALAEAIDAVKATASELTAVASVGRLPTSAPAFGDASGAVHWHWSRGVISRTLHRGRVTALAGTVLGGRGLPGSEIPLLVSGGLDGTVRLWGPGSDPMAEPFHRRDCPVTAVAADMTPTGPLVAAAWSDGLIRLRSLGHDDEVRDLRLGSEIRSLALAGTLLVLGMPDGMAAIDTLPRANADPQPVR